MTRTNPRRSQPEVNEVRRALRRFAADERGGEVIEWALVAGLVVIAAITAIGTVGTRVLARWNTVNSGL